MKVLDLTGLAVLWAAIKTYVESTVASAVTAAINELDATSTRY